MRKKHTTKREKTLERVRKRDRRKVDAPVGDRATAAEKRGKRFLGSWGSLDLGLCLRERETRPGED